MSSAPLKFSSKLIGTAFFGVWFIVGVLFLVFAGRHAWDEISVRFWASTNATVLESRVEEGEESPSLYVRYRYAFEGVQHSSDQVQRGRAQLQRNDAYRLAQRFAVGSLHRCRVNQAQPDQAVLLTGSVWSAFLLVVPLVVTIIGVVGLWALWRRQPAESWPEAPGALSAGAGRKDLSRRFVLLFMGAFALIGGVLTYLFAVKPTLRVWSAKSWHEVPCEVVSSRVRTHRDSDGSTYSVEVVYRYVYSGRQYTSNLHSFVTGSSSGYEGKRAVVRAWPPGKKGLCYVNPEDPTDAVLDRGLRTEMAFGLIPAVFCVIGLVGIAWAGRHLPDEAGRAPGRAEQPWRVGQAQSVRQKAEAVTGGGQLELKPRTSRRGKLVGLLLFAAVWNGIVSLFLADVLRGWGRGGTPVFETLFLLPFLGIGLATLFGVVYQFLALFNPVAELTVTPASPAVGTRLTVAWRLRGRSERLRNLRLTLEGMEEATYRRGTSSRTDTHLFSKLVLLETADPTAMQQGVAYVTIPPDTMHSFKARNNCIRWTLRLHGEVPRWPDLKDEYDVVISPRETDESGS